jgi:hypothetical protein
MATMENIPAARKEDFVGFSPKLRRVTAMAPMYIEYSSCLGQPVNFAKKEIWDYGTGETYPC